MSECACGHPQDEHQPDCQAVLRPDVFCECSGFRAEGAVSDPRFRGGHLKAIQEDQMPEWTELAECRKHSMPGQPWAEAFSERATYQSDPDDYRWSANIIQVMRVCSTCPVRRECLDYAYEITKPQSFGDVNLYSSHTKACDDDYNKEKPKAKKCTGCVPDEDRVKRKPFELKQQHEGIFGGIPGSVRQHFRNRPDLAEAWFKAWTARRGWDVPNGKEKTG